MITGFSSVLTSCFLLIIFIVSIIKERTIMINMEPRITFINNASCLSSSSSPVSTSSNCSLESRRQTKPIKKRKFMEYFSGYCNNLAKFCANCKHFQQFFVCLYVGFIIFMKNKSYLTSKLLCKVWILIHSL